MLSVVIATKDSERALVQTLACLVSGATDGFVREVIVADGGSRDETEAVADVAGCNFVAAEGPLGRHLKQGAGLARASWLLFLRPGTILEPLWTAGAGRFVERASPNDAAATFRRGASAQPGFREALSMLAASLGARPRPEQGLIISKEFYERLGGHSELASDPEADLLRRIGKRRLVTLAAAAETAQ
jgi:hypothetical protein